MHLRSVSLRDWKAYEVARFDFPEPDGDHNVILIGGQNGFGKTTLFEAIALGLYGAYGLPLISRATAAADEQNRGQSFRNFIERALNGHAIRAGRRSCHVVLTFQDQSGQPIVIERTWHFTDAGRLRPGEGAETVRIMKGLAREVIGPGPAEADPQGWYRDWIARTFMPASLAGFFLFDGEAASVYAERDMAVQVREGIEGLLGLNWFRTLSESLRDYATRRRSEVPRGVNTDAVTMLESQISVLAAEVKNAGERLEQIAPDLANADAERDALTRELAGYGTGTRAQLEELIKERADQEKAYDMAKEKLFQIASGDLPLALSGVRLRSQLAERLTREQRLAQWQASAKEGQGRIEHVIEGIEHELTTIVPPLVPTQGEWVKEVVRRALDRLWHPAPDDAAESFRHLHAQGAMGERVLARLDQAAKVTVGTVSSLLGSMARAAAALRNVNAAIQASEVTAPQLEEKRARIAALNIRVRVLSEENGEKSSFIASRNADLEQKRKELGRLTGQLDQSARPARLAKRAEEVALMLDDLAADAWPIQAQAIASAMTLAVTAMAHRDDYLRRVEITNDGQVMLLAPNGRNLREFDLSAGEKQIFTQALFWAIAHVSGRVFPLVIDTPLGRLDQEHRLNVLRHLVQRDGQVVLISTNTEVVGPYLDAIRSRVLKACRIENSTNGDIGLSWPVEGYFPGQGI